MIPLRLPRLESTSELPPGQTAISTFPRYGAHFGQPTPPIASSIRISGEVEMPFDIDVGELAAMEREHMTADFHCVAGWSYRGLHWDGVRFKTFYEAVIAPLLPPDTRVTHLLLRGADGFEATLLLEDACADNVLLADSLGGGPLTAKHGAPVRLVSPTQYGYKSVKHLVAIELHSREPRERHARPLADLALPAVRSHPRARVAREERHRYLPGWAVRWPYRNLAYPLIGLLARRGQWSSRHVGARRSST
jgi:DMSO/TMAO reductase YedYZ molybdopterin-dependent catalytic subunit